MSRRRMSWCCSPRRRPTRRTTLQSGLGPPFNRSREVAYAIMSYINAEALGEAKRPIRAEWVTKAYGHCQQWMDQSTWGVDQVAPFMMAITSQSLIEDWDRDAGRALPPGAQGARRLDVAARVA